MRVEKIEREKKTKNSKFLGMVRDALGDIRGSFLSNVDGFSKDFEKIKIRSSKIDQNRFRMG